MDDLINDNASYNESGYTLLYIFYTTLIFLKQCQILWQVRLKTTVIKIYGLNLIKQAQQAGCIYADNYLQNI